MTKIEDILPILDIENEAIVSKMGDITIGFSVKLPEIFTMSDQDYEALHHSWIKAIKVLPWHSVLHKQDWFTEANYAGAFKNAGSFLSRSSERFFHERP